MFRNVVQVINFAGLAINIEMLFINHYYGIGEYALHTISIVFFLISMFLVKLSKVL